MSTYTIQTDPDGRRTIWTKAGTRYVADRDGDMIRVNPIHADEIWSLLARALAPDEATIERLAKVVVPYDELSTSADYVIVRRILAALAGTSAQARHTADDATEAAS